MSELASWSKRLPGAVLATRSGLVIEPHQLHREGDKHTHAERDGAAGDQGPTPLAEGLCDGAQQDAERDGQPATT